MLSKYLLSLAFSFSIVRSKILQCQTFSVVSFPSKLINISSSLNSSSLSATMSYFISKMFSNYLSFVVAIMIWYTKSLTFYLSNFSRICMSRPRTLDSSKCSDYMSLSIIWFKSGNEAYLRKSISADISSFSSLYMMKIRLKTNTPSSWFGINALRSIYTISVLGRSAWLFFSTSINT